MVTTKVSGIKRKTREPIEALMPVGQKCGNERPTCGQATHVIDFELPYDEGDESYEGEMFFCKEHYDLLVEFIEKIGPVDVDALDAFLDESAG